MRSAWFAVAPAVSGVPAVSEAFTVRVPEGWVDLSRGAPAANCEGLRPSIAAQVQSGQYVALAYDFAHEDAAFTENLNATVQSGAERVTGRSIAALTRELLTIAARNTPSVALRERPIRARRTLEKVIGALSVGGARRGVGGAPVGMRRRGRAELHRWVVLRASPSLARPKTPRLHRANSVVFRIQCAGLRTPELQEIPKR